MLRDFSLASSVTRCAAASPAMPPPMMAMRFIVQVEDGRWMIEDCNFPSSILGSYLRFNDLSYHLHNSRMIVGTAGADEANV